MTPDGWARLWAIVRPESKGRADVHAHCFGSEELGEYAAARLRYGLTQAEHAFPEIAAHLKSGCETCSIAAEEVASLLTLAHRVVVAPRESPDITKRVIYAAAKRFVTANMPTHARAFEALWNSLESLSLAALANVLAVSGENAPAGGLAFAESSQALIPVLATTIWAVVDYYSPDAQPKDRPVDALVAKAQSFGMSGGVAYMLAMHLQATLGPGRS